ncbi:hypothetical protein ZOD2009_12707 [Haladaptatus paucihalophilus DX253]|uniref:Uncharacterized protein n=1 Tax=Haladaptatus paucihalophilus DX253 TaxID=797209 RepID=E7QUQ7_HALPU|nr:hypothetical protein ZOD2009_12707 [Haladaptatus paucihalophilus DX253]
MKATQATYRKTTSRGNLFVVDRVRSQRLILDTSLLIE